MERVKGIEPSYSAWEAGALPLCYTRIVQVKYHRIADFSSPIEFFSVFFLFIFENMKSEMYLKYILQPESYRG